MKLMYYEFASPSALADVLSQLLIVNSITVCVINYNDYSELHFDNYLLRINKDETITMFNTYQFENLINTIVHKNSIKNSNNRIIANNGLMSNDNYKLCIPELPDDYLSIKPKHKYKDANYISKRKIIQHNNKLNKVNTKKK